MVSKVKDCQTRKENTLYLINLWDPVDDNFTAPYK